MPIRGALLAKALINEDLELTIATLSLLILGTRSDIVCVIYFGTTPHPATITTRNIPFLVGNPHKPSFWEDSHFDSFFSDGLKPSTSYVLGVCEFIPLYQ